MLAGDAVFQDRNLEPNAAEGWRHWVPARFVDSVAGWRSVEEIDKRADYVLACHDKACGDHESYPYEGMPLRARRQHIPGFPFHFGDMPPGAAARAAPAMPASEVEGYLASLKAPKADDEA